MCTGEEKEKPMEFICKINDSGRTFGDSQFANPFGKIIGEAVCVSFHSSVLSLEGTGGS